MGRYRADGSSGIPDEQRSREDSSGHHGWRRADVDEAVPVANTRMWVDTMKELKLDYEYKEYPGLTHGPIIDGSMPDIFAYFAKHTKAGRK